MSYEAYERMMRDISIEAELRFLKGPAIADLWVKARDERTKGQNDVLIAAQGVYLLYQPGKRNPVVTMKIGKNPDGTVNLIGVNDDGNLGFYFNVPTSLYRDDANQPYARAATKVE